MILVEETQSFNYVFLFMHDWRNQLDDHIASNAQISVNQANKSSNHLTIWDLAKLAEKIMEIQHLRLDLDHPLVNQLVLEVLPVVQLNDLFLQSVHAQFVVRRHKY